jgi:long-subunit acyl-CoA synthetase (AMP-forming)
MPKAAVITHLRFMFMASGVFKMFGIGRDEVVYNTLPLYHTGDDEIEIYCEFLINFGANFVSWWNAWSWDGDFVWMFNGAEEEIFSFKLLE